MKDGRKIIKMKADGSVLSDKTQKIPENKLLIQLITLVGGDYKGKKVKQLKLEEPTQKKNRKKRLYPNGRLTTIR